MGVIKKRVSAFALAVLLSFGVCATDYLEVQALEWAGVTIGLDTALKFLLGLVGVSVGVGVADSIDWTETREQCITFQQNQGNSAVAVSNWWADVIRGKLDTASECWQSFKEWVKNDLLSGSSSGVVDFSQGVKFSTFKDSVGFSGLDSYNDRIVLFAYYFESPVSPFYGNKGLFIEFINEDSIFYNNVKSIDYRSNLYNFGITMKDDSLHVAGLDSLVKFKVNSSGVISSFSSSSSYGPNTIYKNYIYNFSLDSSFPQEIIDISSDIPSVDSDFEGAYENVTDIGLGSSIAIDLPSEGVLDIPWENVGDTAESVDGAIENALENVNAGTWSLDQYWEYVQNVTNVYAYDITNNFLLPNDGNNETTEDKVQENVNRNAFVLAGLEKVFPFCIPWDIYAFLTLLVAEPVAPIIEYPIYNPVTDTEEIITIDFSVWEQQVIIMRYIFDFLLIIGLLLLARSLIGAGGSD